MRSSEIVSRVRLLVGQEVPVTLLLAKDVSEFRKLSSLSAAYMPKSFWVNQLQLLFICICIRSVYLRDLIKARLIDIKNSILSTTSHKAIIVFDCSRTFNGNTIFFTLSHFVQEVLTPILLF